MLAEVESAEHTAFCQQQTSKTHQFFTFLCLPLKCWWTGLLDCDNRLCQRGDSRLHQSQDCTYTQGELHSLAFRSTGKF